MSKYKIVGHQVYDKHEFSSHDKAKWFLAGTLLQGAAKIEAAVPQLSEAVESSRVQMVDAAEDVLGWVNGNEVCVVGGAVYRIAQTE